MAGTSHGTCELQLRPCPAHAARLAGAHRPTPSTSGAGTARDSCRPKRRPCRLRRAPLSALSLVWPCRGRQVAGCRISISPDARAGNNWQYDGPKESAGWRWGLSPPPAPPSPSPGAVCAVRGAGAEGKGSFGWALGLGGASWAHWTEATSTKIRGMGRVSCTHKEGSGHVAGM